MRYDTSPSMMKAVMMTGPMKCIQEVLSAEDFAKHPGWSTRASHLSACAQRSHQVTSLKPFEAFLSLRRGPYYFQARCWNEAGVSLWPPGVEHHVPYTEMT